MLTGAAIGIFGRAPELATYFNYSPSISAACESLGDRISEPLAKTTGGPPYRGFQEQRRETSEIRIS